MEAYLDNSATTKVCDAAVKVMEKVMTEDYGNPSSLHRKGMEAENYLKNTRSIIAKSLKVNDKEIYFTSGGSEGNNLAIIGAAYANRRRGNHIITTQIEHPSVYQPFKFLEEAGWEVTYLPVDSRGIVQLEELKRAVREDTVLVSMMHVNNEIGTVEPVNDAGRIIKDQNADTLFHVDAIQSYGKVPIDIKNSFIDLLTVSGHKLHAPKGSGFIYIRDKVKADPLIYGGGQENGMRSGTENVPAIAGLGAAVEEMFSDFEGHREKLFALKKSLVEQLSQIEGVTFNGPYNDATKSAPHILSVSVENVRAEVLLHALEAEGVYVSAGSACSSNRPAVSRTLKSIHLKEELLGSTIRFSLSIHTTQEEIDYAAKVMQDVIPKLRKYTRR